MHASDWAQPNPFALLDPAGPPLDDVEPLAGSVYPPEAEALLSELGAFYPVVAYPAAQASDDGEEEVDQTICAGLIWP